jgi:hypothetical protein
MLIKWYSLKRRGRIAALIAVPSGGDHASIGVLSNRCCSSATYGRRTHFWVSLVRSCVGSGSWPDAVDSLSRYGIYPDLLGFLCWVRTHGQRDAAAGGGIGVATRRPSARVFGAHARHGVDVRALLCRHHGVALEILFSCSHRFLHHDYIVFDGGGVACNDAGGFPLQLTTGLSGPPAGPCPGNETGRVKRLLVECGTAVGRGDCAGGQVRPGGSQGFNGTAEAVPFHGAVRTKRRDIGHPRVTGPTRAGPSAAFLLKFVTHPKILCRIGP